MPAIGGATGNWSRDHPAGAREGERCDFCRTAMKRIARKDDGDARPKRVEADHQQRLIERVSPQCLGRYDEPPPLPLSALWLRTRKMPARTRLLIDFLAARLAGEKL
jgi:DNA-binding transcriptional LysR family regulator